MHVLLVLRVPVHRLLALILVVFFGPEDRVNDPANNNDDHHNCVEFKDSENLILLHDLSLAKGRHEVVHPRIEDLLRGLPTDLCEG